MHACGWIIVLLRRESLINVVVYVINVVVYIINDVVYIINVVEYRFEPAGKKFSSRPVPICRQGTGGLIRAKTAAVPTGADRTSLPVNEHGGGLDSLSGGF